MNIKVWKPCLACNGEEGQFLNGDWYDCDTCEGEGGQTVVMEESDEP